MTEANPKRDAWPELVFWPVSFLAVALWPALAGLASFSFVEHDWEYGFLFGGITTFLLLPLIIIFEFTDMTVAVIEIVLWVLIWFIPCLWCTLRRWRFTKQIILIGILSLLSLVQAAMGFLMIIGKSV